MKEKINIKINCENTQRMRIRNPIRSMTTIKT